MLTPLSYIHIYIYIYLHIYILYYNAGRGVGWKYGIHAYVTDANPTRDLGTPAGWTEKFWYLEQLYCSTHNISQRKCISEVCRLVVRAYSYNQHTPQPTNIGDTPANKSRVLTFPEGTRSLIACNNHCRKPSVKFLRHSSHNITRGAALVRNME